MRIGVDIMGGDYAPLETTLGAIEALKELPAHTRLVLIGDSEKIIAILKANNVDESSFDIIHTSENVEMTDSATKVFSQKPNSGMAIGFGLLKQKKIDAFASAGNSGAMLVGSIFSVKAANGILRPAISTILPKEDGSFGILLDVGANADCKPEVLQQFGVLGSLLAEHVYQIKKPRVALMNIGEEEEKGNILSQQAHQLLKATKEINFIGNVEGRDLFNTKADVVVCDGFTGNVMLKEAESFYTLIKKRGIRDEYFDRFDYENYGGTPVLGVNGNVIMAHGISKAKAIKNMILLSIQVTQANLSEKIATAFQSNAVNHTL
ncbi:MAG: phosphate acyltransferase PlsX [Bacteroidetes bacterium]|nr:phosphate acyltransferase PlsX [Bacteroidota bacterium]